MIKRNHLQYALEVDITKIAEVSYDQHIPIGRLVHILDTGRTVQTGTRSLCQTDSLSFDIFFFIILTSLSMYPQWHHQASRCTRAHGNRTCGRTVQHPHSQELL